MKKIQLFLLIIAAVFIAALLFQVKRLNTVIEQKDLKIGELNEKLNFHAVQKIDALIVNKRVVDSKTGEEKIESKVQYVPPESKVEIKTDREGNTEVSFTKGSFCFEPALTGMATLQGFRFAISSRLFYYDKYGAGVGLNTDLKPFVFVDRRIRDFVPFMKNTSVGISYSGDGIGVNINVFL